MTDAASKDAAYQQALKTDSFYRKERTMLLVGSALCGISCLGAYSAGEMRESADKGFAQAEKQRTALLTQLPKGSLKDGMLDAPDSIKARFDALTQVRSAYSDNARFMEYTKNFALTDAVLSGVLSASGLSGAIKRRRELQPQSGSRERS